MTANFWGRVHDLLGRHPKPAEVQGMRFGEMHESHDPAGAARGTGLLTRVGDVVTGRSYEKIEAGQQQLMDLMQAIRIHLDEQNERSERMTTSLSQLAYALSSVPEATRLQNDTLRTLCNHVANGNHKADTLANLLIELQKQQETQAKVVDALCTRIQAAPPVEGRVEQVVGRSMNNLEQAIGSLGTTARQQTDMISRLSELEQKQDSRLIELIRKQNRRFNSLFIVTLVLAGLSVAAAFMTVIAVLAR